MLRAERPEASSELVRSIRGRVGVRPTNVPRFALAGAMTAVLMVALGSVGGLSYAATAANSALKVVKKAVAPKDAQQAIVLQGISAGGDQYRPGYGWGDPNHTHTGPPGLQRTGGEAAPPLRSRPVGSLARRVTTSIALDEQAVLYISVLDRTGNRLLITQKSRRGGSVVGQGLSGMQAKTIRYMVLVPRAIPVALRVPSSLLRVGQTYRIRIIAIDPDGSRRTLFIPFTA